MNFSLLKSTYSNRFRLPVFILPDSEYEDDYVSVIDLLKMKNNLFPKEEILWAKDPECTCIFTDKIPFSSFCSHTINSVFNIEDLKTKLNA